MTTRTWQDNAAEFGVLSKQGRDVRLAVLVATSVEKGKRPPKAGYPRDHEGKVGAETFADQSGTSTDRVLRHLDAWNACAAEGWCKPSSDLIPADASDPDLTIPVEVITWIDASGIERTGTQFESKFDASRSGGRPRASIAEIEKRVESDPVYAEKIAEVVSKAAPEATGKAVAANPAASRAVADERLRTAAEHLDPHRRTPSADEKADAARTSARNAVDEWAAMVARIDIAANDASKGFEKVEADIIAEDLLLVFGSLASAEAHILTLRGKLMMRQDELKSGSSAI